jgi:hypothetical protein
MQGNASDNPRQPTDAQMRARALARWEGEGGTLGPSTLAADGLDESELRILARIGAAALAQWDSLEKPLRETMLDTICRPLMPGAGARAKAGIAKFLEDNANR